MVIVPTFVLLLVTVAIGRGSEFVNRRGCVGIAEVLPRFAPLAVNVAVELLVPPVNESKVGDTVPTFGVEMAMGSLRVEPCATFSGSTNRPEESSRAAYTVRLVCTSWNVWKSPANSIRPRNHESGVGVRYRGSPIGVAWERS